MNKALSCIAAIILCVSTLGAQDGPSDRGNNIGALANYLELNEEQTAGLLALQARFIEEVKGIQEEIRAKKARIKSELNSEFPDANLIGQLMIEIKALNDQKLTIRAELNEPALALLNDDQLRALGPLKRAIRLARPAGQAVHFHLIVKGDGPDSDDEIF